MRAYGIPQAAAVCGNVSPMTLADAIGMDPCEFRLKNCMEDGFVDPANGITFHSYGLKKCIEEGRRHIRWDEVELLPESDRPGPKGCGHGYLLL
ncbi:MAG: hypothetical protein ACLR0U_02100 [Enterocloster clostridioformis]